MAQNENAGTQAHARYTAYFEHRRLLAEGMAQQQAAFDKHILALSVGAVGLSIVFLNDVAPKGSRECIWALLVTWALFCACIACTLVSFLFGKAAHRRQMAIWDEKYTAGAEVDRKAESNAAAPLTTFFTVASIVLLMAGVVFFVIFAYCNL